MREYMRKNTKYLLTGLIGILVITICVVIDMMIMGGLGIVLFGTKDMYEFPIVYILITSVLLLIGNYILWKKIKPHMVEVFYENEDLDNN